MCQIITRRDEREMGALVALCGHYQDCLVRDLELEDQPAKRVFEAFEATVAIIENEYFDLDYRSEFAAVQETAFTASSPDALRLHFFSGLRPRRGTRIYDYLRRMKRAQDRPNGRSRPKEENDGSSLGERSPRSYARYLGYCVLRSSTPTIGRSLITHAALPRDYLADRYDLASHVRTAAVEEVTIFGVSFQAVGVPFMQQDGGLLRCAHVAAWMAHYTAVLRGYVARRPSAAFSSTTEPGQAYGRTYPSDGIPAIVLFNVLRKMDLPPEILDVEALTEERDCNWRDREDLHARVQLAQRSKDPAGQLARVWLYENLTATICRYLNSGMPVIINLDDHSYLACGYLRYEDVRVAPPAQFGPRDIAAFVVNDESVGPYVVLTMDAILGRVEDGTTESFSVLVPLPRGLWLGGASAEVAGMLAFERLLAGRAQLERPDGPPILPEFVVLREEILQAIRANRHSDFGIRSYALPSSDFKSDFAMRTGDAVAARVAGYTSMPKFVWIVELVDRRRRVAGQPSIIGTVVLDGSAVSADGVLRPPTLVFVHIPGEVGGVVSAGWGEEMQWQATHVTHYSSGRWSHRHSSFLSANRLAARVKTVLIGGS